MNWNWFIKPCPFYHKKKLKKEAFLIHIKIYFFSFILKKGNLKVISNRKWSLDFRQIMMTSTSDVTCNEQLGRINRTRRRLDFAALGLCLHTNSWHAVTSCHSLVPEILTKGLQTNQLTLESHTTCWCSISKSEDDVVQHKVLLRATRSNESRWSSF